MMEFEDYDNEKALGKGEFGKDFLVRRKSDQQLFAMKQIPMEGYDDAKKNQLLQVV
jgi:hypothetical protein